MQLTRFWAERRERFGIVECDAFVDLSGMLRDFSEFASLCHDAAFVEALAGGAQRFRRSDVTRLIPLADAYRVECW